MSQFDTQFPYSPAEVEKYLCIDRVITTFLNKIDFKASGTVKITYHNHFSTEHDNLSDAALAIHFHIFTTIHGHSDKESTP